MQNSRAFSLRLAVVALSAALGLASPAFASNDDNHAEGSDDHGGNGHTESHGNGSDDNDSHSDDRDSHSDDRGGISNRAGISPLRVRLAGTVERGARGEAKLKTKLRGNSLEAEVKIRVPSAALAVPNKAAARDATLTLSLSRSGVAYAECDFDFKSFKPSGNGRGLAGYKIEIADRGGLIQSRYGVCDVDLAVPGMQPGVPAIQAGDAASVRIDSNGVDFLDGVF